MKKKMFFLTAILGVALFSFTNVKMNTITSNDNTSLLTLDKVEALGLVEFIIKTNGNVGIKNLNPAYTLEIGATGQSCVAKINGSWISTSDSKAKENIRTLTGSLDVLNRLRSVSYNFKGKTPDELTPEARLNKDTHVIDPALKGRDIYGFVAEELQKVLPNLVFADSAGMLAVDYTGIIPVLVASVQEQQKTIETQQKQIDRLLQMLDAAVIFRSSDVTSAAKVDAEGALLYQNTPNPFKENTEIRYKLPATAKTAEIQIYNISGSLVKQYPADASGIVVVKGSDLKAGIYSYTLIVDNYAVDTKKMILTK
jgi:predicted small secreted protein